MSRAPSRRAYFLIGLFALALVALPFWFWYDTWFGRRLSDEKIEEYIHNQQRPRRIQQALVHLGERMARGDVSARRWYGQVIALAAHSNPEVRQTAAWIMGQDKSHEPFGDPLRKLLADSSPVVRRNAALALAAFRDASGRAELVAMLRPSNIAAPSAGKIAFRLKTGDFANPGTLVARVGEEEVRGSLPGEIRLLLVKDGSQVEKGQPIVELSPSDEHAWEALRALYLVGTREDLDDVRRFIRSSNEKLQQQAQLTLRAVEGR